MGQTDVLQVDPLSDTPAYKQIAHFLREQIDAGVYRPGDKLPSELQLVARTGVARETARHAIEVLRLEGRVRTKQGKGVFVQADIRPVIARTSERLRPEHRRNGKAPLRVDETISNVRLDQVVVHLAEVPAPARVAKRLGLTEGDNVFVRRRVISYHDGPSLQLADSYLPLDIAVGRIREADSGPGGIYQRIEENGHRLTRFNERLAFRMPTPGEKRRLELGDGIPVFDFVRVAYAADRPVECFVALMAGDKYRFEYEIEADHGD